MSEIELNTLFDEVIDFLTTSPTPEQIIAFQPSERLHQRLHQLLEQNRTTGLSNDERAELEEFRRLNHFLNMLRIRARQRLIENHELH